MAAGGGGRGKVRERAARSESRENTSDRLTMNYLEQNVEGDLLSLQNRQKAGQADTLQQYEHVVFVFSCRNGGVLARRP